MGLNIWVNPDAIFIRPLVTIVDIYISTQFIPEREGPTVWDRRNLKSFGLNDKDKVSIFGHNIS